MTAYSWYSKLRKPSWAPPSWIFGPVWTVLYIGIAVSFCSVFLKAVGGTVPWTLTIPFAVNLIANVAFTPLQFKLRSNLLAAFDVLIVLISLLWAMIAVYPFATWITYAQIPYLLWVSFATCLQLTITYLNSPLAKSK